jgi:hypothetical protein
MAEKKNDEHVFHWDDVDIIETYGINESGKWKTEVQIAYLEEGLNSLLYSVGYTELELK